MAQAVLPWSLGSVGWSCQLTMQKSKTGDAACPALVVTSDWAVRENTSIGRRGLERRLFRIKSTTAALPNVPSSVAPPTRWLTTILYIILASGSLMPYSGLQERAPGVHGAHIYIHVTTCTHKTKIIKKFN